MLGWEADAVIVFGMVLAGLVGLAVLSDRASGWLRRSGEGEDLVYRCPACDLSYARRQLLNAGAMCPRGHPVVPPRPQPPFGTAVLVAAAAFVAVGLVLYWAGMLKAP